MAKPILKWPGGKARALPNILPLLRERVDRGDLYVEPFFGGGSVGLALEPKRWVFADANHRLREMYRTAALSPTKVVSMLTAQPQNAEHYYELRDIVNRAWEALHPTMAAAAVIYLNKLSYNGIWRENQSGGMNVPWGHKKKPIVWDADGICAAAIALDSAKIAEDWQDAIALQPDVIYADPPYDPVKKTSFVGYGATRFGWDDQVALADALAAAAQRGATVVASNAATERVRALYAERGFTIDTVQMRRNINRNGKGRSAVDELLMHRNACELPKAAE